jgi:hypothetical protein
MYLHRVCAEEEAEEGHEFRVSARDEYYQENARTPREKFNELLKYDIDEYWCAMHVLQTQYTLQIVRCNSIECCGPWRSNYRVSKNYRNPSEILKTIKLSPTKEGFITDLMP